MHLQVGLAALQWGHLHKISQKQGLLQMATCSLPFLPTSPEQSTSPLRETARRQASRIPSSVQGYLMPWISFGDVHRTWTVRTWKLDRGVSHFLVPWCCSGLLNIFEISSIKRSCRTSRLCTYVCVLSHLSHVQLCVTLWTKACQDPLSTGFSRWAYWSRLPFPSPGDLQNPRTEPVSLTSPALVSMFFTTSATWEAKII